MAWRWNVKWDMGFHLVTVLLLYCIAWAWCSVSVIVIRYSSCWHGIILQQYFYQRQCVLLLVLFYVNSIWECCVALSISYILDSWIMKLNGNEMNRVIMTYRHVSRESIKWTADQHCLCFISSCRLYSSQDYQLKFNVFLDGHTWKGRVQTFKYASIKTLRFYNKVAMICYRGLRYLRVQTELCGCLWLKMSLLLGLLGL